MSGWVRDSSSLLVRVIIEDPQSLLLEYEPVVQNNTNKQANMNPNNNNNMNNQENVQAGGRTMMDNLCPNTTARESPIHMPVQAYGFEIKLAMLVNLPIIRGVQNENPYTHVELFEEIVSTVQADANIWTEWVKLQLFPFFLKEQAKEWFNMLRPGSIRTWIDLQKEFYKKYFSISCTTQLKRAITLFYGHLGKSFHKVWKRFNECVNPVPHHGFTAYFDELSTNNQTWKMAGTTELTMATGKYVLHDMGDNDVRTQLAKLTRQLEMLTTKKVHEPNPQGQHSVRSSNEGHMEHLKAVTTLRSGREVDKTIYPKATNVMGPRVAPTLSHGERPSVSEERNVEKDESVENEQVGVKAHEGPRVRNNGEGKNVEKESVETPTPAYHSLAPFPQWLRAPKKPNQNAEIYKLFEQVKINIPLLDAVKQIFAYAKFLKDLRCQEDS
ncbi:hypothetical protein Acr_00g0036900 [Actinidia rufa]|uniref:Retrotransposon gag domain-containing protein n=1 Tax=Actinidia rufa TaxID=165716 RepID=A0A7J0DGX5_9ERIC|nr:hypothetical protein Acr_00g0036900 [Actinidia rufa]